ncbi:hypothetical protein DVH24_014891 [Malus domestica]|uniref:PB1 domain-containing protein n=1 Tax=Malus domestica TaxID=3750 RepID=A0A498K845_MALDO|nr:hypothetical protein DVH24_014891 [Malus domestica]
MEKLKEFCGYSVELKCPLPNRDLETLIAVKFDDESMNIIEEYGRASSPPRPLKIKTILAPPKSPKQISPLIEGAPAALAVLTDVVDEALTGASDSWPEMSESGSRSVLLDGKKCWSIVRASSR